MGSLTPWGSGRILRASMWALFPQRSCQFGSTEHGDGLGLAYGEVMLLGGTCVGRKAALKGRGSASAKMSANVYDVMNSRNLCCTRWMGLCMGQRLCM